MLGHELPAKHWHSPINCPHNNNNNVWFLCCETSYACNGIS
jgi:hypothetical protein